jgi:hypothetical protein
LKLTVAVGEHSPFSLLSSLFSLDQRRRRQGGTGECARWCAASTSAALASGYCGHEVAEKRGDRAVSCRETRACVNIDRF